MRKIGILGGTFNPVHNGHIKMAEYSKKSVALDEIILIPDYVPPHKESDNLANEKHRLNMCKIACSKFENFGVSDVEIKRKGKSYTYQTLQFLKSVMYKDDEIYFIVGADMFLSLQNWKNPDIIFQIAKIIAIPRDNDNKKELENHFEKVLKPMGASVIILEHSVLDVSSTFVRGNINNENIIKNYIDDKVYEYIRNNNLYGCDF